MTKAYDPKALVAKLKGKGLNIAEEAARAVAESVFEWFEESAKLSATPLDDVALILVPQLKSAALGAIDKIDNKVG